MPLGKALESAMKAISYIQPHVEQSYQLQRMIDSLGKFSFFKAVCTVTETDVAAVDHDIHVRIFHPRRETDVNDVILFFHGGGWVTGDIESYNKVCAVTALKTGCKVASVDYRLAPEHKFPEGLEDCYAVARQFYWNAHELFGVSPDRITLMGDSAGGNLAAAVALRARDEKDFSPARQILVYPATYHDHSDRSPHESVRTNGSDYLLTAQRIREYMALYMRSPKDLENPYFAPLRAKDFSDQPDTLIITAEYDPLRDEGEAYGHALRAAGNRVEIYRALETIHGFFSLSPRLHAVKESYRVINQFLKESEHGET